MEARRISSKMRTLQSSANFRQLSVETGVIVNTMNGTLATRYRCSSAPEKRLAMSRTDSPPGLPSFTAAPLSTRYLQKELFGAVTYETASERHECQGVEGWVLLTGREGNNTQHRHLPFSQTERVDTGNSFPRGVTSIEYRNRQAFMKGHRLTGMEVRPPLPTNTNARIVRSTNASLPGHD